MDHELKKTTTAEILQKYREVFHREALQQWRDVIPRDVRKYWIQAFVRQVGKDKLLHKPEYRAVLEEHAPDVAQRIEEMNRRIALADQYADDDYSETAIDALNQADAAEEGLYDIWMHWKPTDQALEAFAQIYFTMFDADPAHYEAAVEQQEQDVRAVVDAIECFQNHPEKLLQLYEEYPMTIDDRPSVQDELQKHGSPASLVRIVDGALIVGSGAVGPREASHSQDTDMLLLPAAEGNQQRLNTTIITYLAAVLKLEDFESRDHLYAKIEYIWPDGVRLAQTEAQLDIGVPEADAFGNARDWKKWCGPHRFLPFTDSAQKKYEGYVEQAIAEARRQRDVEQRTGKQFDTWEIGW